MNRYKVLLKNISYLTVGTFTSKFLLFLLVPLYTGILSTQEYGTFDLISNSIDLLLPILTLNIIEAVLRFPIDKDKDVNYVSSVYTIGVRYSLYGSSIVFLLLGLNHIFMIVPSIIQYEVYIFLLYFVQAFNQLFTSFGRAINRIKEIAIAGVLNSIALVSLNLLFLLYFKLGLAGYFWAIIISYIVSNIYYAFTLGVHKYFRLKVDKKLVFEMIAYSFPMVFNTVGWWINNVSDRYIVTWLCGAAANGIYSISYKIPSILNVFHAIFMQAWILSAVKEYKSEKNSQFFRNVYNSYSGLLVVITSLLIILSKPIAFVLFQKEFYQAWKYAPFLLIAVIFGSLSGVLGGVFSAEKDSKMFAISTGIGALTNIVLTIVLVKSFGPLGAAVATAISAYVVWLFRLIQTNKYLSLDLRLFRDHGIYIILIIQSIMLLVIDAANLYYPVSVILLLTIIFLYKSELSTVYNSLKNKRTQNTGG